MLEVVTVASSSVMTGSKHKPWVELLTPALLHWRIRAVLSERLGGFICKSSCYFFLPLILSFLELFILFYFQEFLFCPDGGAQNSEESLQFLNKLLSAEHFLQVGDGCHSSNFKFSFLSALTHKRNSFKCTILQQNRYIKQL